jgi:hypothetical protein
MTRGRVTTPQWSTVVILTTVAIHPAARPRIIKETATAATPGSAQPWSV